MPAHLRPHLLMMFCVLVVTAAAHSQTTREPASRLQRDEADRETREKVSAIFEAMGVRPGAVVADVGAGGGFLTVRLARLVGADGRVVAVDVNPQVVERLRTRVAREGLANVEVVKGESDDPRLPPASLDAAVIVNSYHEMADYAAMLRHLRQALKTSGRLVIVEPISEKRREGSRAEQTRAHEIDARYVEQDVRDAGFRVVRLEDPLTTHGSEVQWLLVAQPSPARPPQSTATAPKDDEGAEPISDPGLRITFERFLQMREQNAIVLVDVRSEDEFQSGHIPGAIWIPLDRIAEHAESLRARGKPIVTYCS